MDIRFHGREADQHEIEAYAGAVSLEGIARAASIAAHYAATGEVRFRGPYSSAIEFRFTTPEAGSLDFPLKAVSNLSKGAGRASKAIALFVALLSRSTGQPIPEEAVDITSEIREGDLDAMAEGVSPGLWRAHRWIDDAEKRIEVTSNAATVELNSRTKDYLEYEEQEDPSAQDVTVAAVNANARTGRVWFENLGRTIPFKVGKEANGRTLSNLARYLANHVEKTNDWVNIVFVPIRYSDGRLKRIIILDCALASEMD